MVKTKLGGYAIIICKIKNSIEDKVVSTYLTVDADYTPDWQEDAHCMHDEGWFDFDIEDAQLLAPNEYIEFCTDGTTKEGNSEITKIIKVLSTDFNEEE